MRASLGTKNERFHRRSKRGDLGEIKVCGFGGVLRFPNGVVYAPRSIDSSYFGFIPSFGLNWDCFEVDFGLSLGRFMACFMTLIRTILWPVL